MVATPLPAYDGPAAAGPRMRQHEQRISNLERGLAVLETVVERLAASMDAEHRAQKEARQEDRAAMRRLGEQMKSSITILAEKMEKMAEKSISTDRGIIEEQSRTRGAFAGANWVLNTFVAVAGLLFAAGGFFLAYQAGSNSNTPEHYERPTR